MLSCHYYHSRYGQVGEVNHQLTEPSYRPRTYSMYQYTVDITLPNIMRSAISAASFVPVGVSDGKHGRLKAWADKGVG